MRIEVLCTGDELLTGVTADTNSPFFMARLLRLGERVSRTTIVGDNRDAIVEALRETSARADVVLVSGGLGPTSDDVTVEAAAAAAGVPLVEDAATVEHLRRRFDARRLALTANNLRQARVPTGAEVIQNPEGAAPMLILMLGACRLFFVPGVPGEYRHLVANEVLPRILQQRQAAGAEGAIAFRILKTLGLPESHLDEAVAPLRGLHPEVTFGFRTVAPENHLELLATGGTRADAARVLAAAATACEERLRAHLFGADDDTLEGAVVSLLHARRETVTFAESCTGGLVAAAVTAVPGASEVFPGALVTYAERLKSAWAQVPAELLETHGAVSEEVACRMAEGARDSAATDWSVAVTGFAGPGGGTPDAPVGTVFISVSGAGRTTVAKHLMSGDRSRIRAAATAHALDALRRRLLEEGPR